MIEGGIEVLDTGPELESIGTITVAVSNTSSSEVTTFVTYMMLVDCGAPSEESKGTDKADLAATKISNLTTAFRDIMQMHRIATAQGKDRTMVPLEWRVGQVVVPAEADFNIHPVCFETRWVQMRTFVEKCSV